MARLPKRLVGPALIATGPTTVYTAPSYVPTTLVTIVRQIHVSNDTGTAANFTLSIGADGVTTRLWKTYSVPAAGVGVTDSVRDIFVYFPMTTGEIITLSAGTNNVLTIVITGDENV